MDISLSSLMRAKTFWNKKKIILASPQLSKLQVEGSACEKDLYKSTSLVPMPGTELVRDSGARG